MVPGEIKFQLATSPSSKNFPDKTATGGTVNYELMNGFPSV